MNEKYALFALSSNVSKVKNDIILGDDISITTHLPFFLDKHWAEWIGSIRTDNYSKSNLFILSKSVTESPDILDHENIALVQNVERMFYSMLITGNQKFSSEGIIITGSINDNNYTQREIRFSDIRYHVIDNIETLRITESSIMKAYDVYKALKYVFDPEHVDKLLYYRLRIGINAYIKSTTEYSSFFKVTQLIRTMESMILPRIASTKKDFMHRCKAFIKGKGVSERVGELYEIRSRVEHIHSPHFLYSEIDRFSSSQIIDSRTIMADAVARFMLCNVLTLRELLVFFVDNSTIDKFWKLTDVERNKYIKKKLSV